MTIPAINPADGGRLPDYCFRWRGYATQSTPVRDLAFGIPRTSRSTTGSQRRSTSSVRARPRGSQPARLSGSAGNVSSVHLSSCRQAMSGLAAFSQCSRLGRRLLRLLMLKVATFSDGPDRFREGMWSTHAASIPP
jgi:hypothetical protein